MGGLGSRSIFTYGRRRQVYKLQVMENGEYRTLREGYDLKLMLFIAGCLSDLHYEARVAK